ncbi:MAG: acyltransferase family protein [Candidatus Dormibacteria bacterium]
MPSAISDSRFSPVIPRRGGEPAADGMVDPRSRGRLPAADLVRAVALLLVILIHAAPWPSHATAAANGLYSGLSLAARVSVPLFVLLSGLLLAHAHRQISGAGRFWARRLRRTLMPWIPWALIYFALTVGFQGMSPAPSQSWGWWAGGAGHLFFLLLVPQLYLLYLVWPKGRRSSLVALGAAILVQVSLQMARVVLPIHGGLGQILLLDYGFEEAPLWVGYFALGIWLGLNPGWMTLSRRWLALTLPASAGALILLFAGLPSRIATNWGPWVHGTGAFLRPSLLLLTALVFLDLWLAAPAIIAWGGARWEAILQSLSRHSLGIYIIHPIFLLGAGPLLEIAPRPFSLQQSLPGSLLPLSILVLGSLGFGWLVTWTLVTSRVTAWSLGEGSTPFGRGRSRPSPARSRAEP